MVLGFGIQVGCADEFGAVFGSADELCCWGFGAKTPKVFQP